MIPICTKCGYVVTDGYIYAINHNVMLCHDCLKTEIEKIVEQKGGYREMEIMNRPYIIEKTETWNDDHKVLHIREFVPQPDGHSNGFEVDIVTKIICG